MAYIVVFTPEAEAQLTELYGYIAVAASPDVAARYTDAIVTYCESLRTFPHRGISRDDIRPGLRITGYRKRVVVAFDVDADRVNIIGVYYGGQDYEAALLEEDEEDSDPRCENRIAPDQLSYIPLLNSTYPSGKTQISSLDACRRR
jgi:toxin ParE1/3/4